MSNALTSLTVLLAALLVACGDATEAPPAGSSAVVVQVFKSPNCGCCVGWADHMERNGFRVETTDVSDLSAIKRRHGVPADGESCHTALVEDYVIEGHVPAADIERLLAERPAVLGLMVPGMPRGSPGMESPFPEPYTVYAFHADGQRTVFSEHE